MWYDDIKFLTASYQQDCQAVLDKFFEGYWTLQLVTRGTVRIGYDEQWYELTANNRQGWVWPHLPGPRARLQPVDRHTSWEHRHIAFRGPIVADWLAAGLFPTKPVPVGVPRQFAHAFDACRQEIFSEQAGAHAQAAHLCEGILLELDRQRRANAEPEWLRKVKAVMASGRVDDFDAVALAAQVGMGVSTLRRRFREQVGVSMREWSMATRMRQAALLLVQESDSIAGIADRLGYHDTTYFIKQFRRHHGLTPRAYRVAQLS